MLSLHILRTVYYAGHMADLNDTIIETYEETIDNLHDDTYIIDVKIIVNALCWKYS